MVGSVDCEGNGYYGLLKPKQSTFALLHPRHARLVRGAAHERSVGGVRRFRFVFVTGYKLLMVAQVPKDISGLIGS
jgi:hypothetical protein